MADEVSALRAIAHPVRLRILSLLTGAAMSAAEVARELDLTHANASYHLRVLADAGELEVAGEQRIRGGIAKLYRHPWNRAAGDRRPSGDPTTAREQYVRAMAAELVRRHAERKPRLGGHFTDAEVWVAADVWAQVVALVTEASQLVHAEAQAPRTAGTVHVNVSAALFEMEP